MGNTAAELPPNSLNLGNGEAFVFGSAGDIRAAAKWLEEHYPGGAQGERIGPLIGPMLNMKIHHSRPVRGFAKLPNETLRDERLSIAARGHLAYLLSLPDGWNTTADAEAKRARSLRGKRGEGRDAMRRIYAELKDAGYIRYVRTQDNGTWSTEIHVFDHPGTDIRLADIPETRISVPPAEMPEDQDDMPDAFSQVAPIYGSPGVGTPAVGTPVHRQAVHSYEDGTTEDEGKIRAVDGEAGDLGGPGVVPRYEDDDQGQGQEQPFANSQNLRVHKGPETVADDAQDFSLHDAESATTGSYAREAETEPAVPADFEEHRRREQDRLVAWMLEHPEAAVTQ